MNESNLDAWFAKAREAEPGEPREAPPGFAAVVWQEHQRRVATERAAVRTSLFSIVTALFVLATVVDLNFDSLTAPPDDPGYVGDLASSVWDSTGD